jgi:hypothetical protein
LVSSPLGSLALLLMFPAAIFAFTKLPALSAVLFLLLGGTLFLPERLYFDLPGGLLLDKYHIPHLCALVGILVVAKRQVREARLGTGIDILVFVMLLAAIGTALTNRDALQFGPTRITGLNLISGLSRGFSILFGVIAMAAFLVARVLVRTGADARQILNAWVIASLVYSPFMLVELRMSPQWNNWIYGFHQHSFAQAVREGGYRPMVFMAHGLSLAVFTCAGAFAAWALVKGRTRVLGYPSWPVAAFLSLLLVGLNSLGALVYLVVMLPVAWFLTPKTQLRVAAILAIFVFFYPVMRGLEFFPRQGILDLSAQISQDRAGSLAFRFNNEDQLFERAMERPLFGWGQSARSHVFSAETGRDISVTDGAWIGVLGQTGIIGYAAYYGLLLLPIFMALRAIDRIAVADRPLISGFALVLTIYAVDQIPNGIFNGLGMLIAGAVAGLAQGMPNEKKGPRPELRALLAALLYRRLARRHEAARSSV